MRHLRFEMDHKTISELLNILKHEAPLGLPREWFDDCSTAPKELELEKVSNDRTDQSMARVQVKTKESTLIRATSTVCPEASMSWEELELTAKGCRKCGLCETRNSVVFGDGDHIKPTLVFVGEGPGAEEDKRGLPFVGRAGELLTNAINKGMGLERSQVYICNVVKCRPPENRQPLPEETAACTPYLFRQLELINPKVIVTLGQQAQLAVCGVQNGITKIRGKWLDWRGIKVMPTLHPAYLLRNPVAKKDFWADLQVVMEELGLERKESIQSPGPT